MGGSLHCYVILVCITRAMAKDPEPDLPPCPTNYQFLPNSLPMHCKMVNPPAPYPVAPPGPFPPQFPPFFAGPIPGKPAGNNPGPAKPVAPPPGPMFPPAPVGMPAMPMGAPMPMGMPGMPMGMPGMPMVGGPPQQKMPVIVMPFYSPDPSYKNSKAAPHRRPRPYKRRIRVMKKRHRSYDTDSSTDADSSDTDTSSSSDSDRGFWNWKNRRAMSRRKKIKHTRNKKEYLTPILQYVSKDGYVIFEKQISKGEAKDWLGDAKGPNEVAPKEEENKPSQTDTKHDNIDNKPEENEEEDSEPVQRQKSSKSNDLMKKLLVKFTKNQIKSKIPSQPPGESAKRKRLY